MAGTPTQALNTNEANGILESVFGMLRIVLRGPVVVPAGEPLRASLLPASPVIDASDLVSGFLNIGNVAKNRTFSDANPVDLPTSGDLAGDDLLPTAQTGLGTVSGLIGQTFGTVALPNLKVQLDLTWIVRDQLGRELHQEEGHFAAPDGVAAPDLSLLIPPAFAELTLDGLRNPPRPDVYCLSARVVLRLGSVVLDKDPNGNPLEVGPVPFAVARLPVPTVVALWSEPFLDVGYGGQVNGADDIVDSSVLVAVPEHSPFASAGALFDALRKVEGALDAVRDLAGVAGFLLPVGDLLDIPQQPRFRFAAQNAIHRFDGIKLKPKQFFGFTYGYEDFDDRVYSIVVIGLPGTTVEFFNDVDYRLDRHQGSFTVRVGAEGFVVIRTLDSDDDLAPVTMPANRVVSFTADTGGDDLWHTDMSSMRFAPGWLETVRPGPTGPPNLTCLGIEVGADMAVDLALDGETVVATVTNHGPANATQVVLDLVANGAELGSATASIGTVDGPANGHVALTVPALAAGAQAELRVGVKPAALLFGASASVVADQLDPDLLNNRAELSVDIGGPTRG
jgi:hypothetical protein